MINILRKKSVIIAIVSVIIVSIIGIIAYSSLKSNKTIQTVGGETSNKLSLEEEIIPEVKEEVIAVTKDVSVDQSAVAQEEQKEEETIKYKDKEVKIPKSKVAAANSSEDAERNKKNGGNAVSQNQANEMFQNEGTHSNGIDVSAHQGKINWAQVAASGVDFAIIRCGFRGQTAGSIYEDAYFKTNVAGATANGVKVGIYFYSTAVNEQEALEEAAWVVKKISTYRITYPVVYDFEDFGAYRCANVGGAQATSNALTFLNFVRANGYEPMMYANKSDITNRMSRGSFNCKFWLAHYTSQTDYKGSYNMWQYTSKGSVPGISGNVDMNVAYFSYGATAAAKHTHDYTELVKGSQKDATCTSKGSKTLRCSCGESKTEEIPMLEHKFSDWKIVKVATTEKEGLKERECTLCHKKETQSIAKLKPSQNATNTSNNSNTTNSTTSSSGVNTTVPDNTGNTTHTHDYSVFVRNDREASCKETGISVYKCSKCELTITKEIPKVSHKPGEWIIDVDATATTEGSKHKNCTVCNEVVATEKIPVKETEPATPPVEDNSNKEVNSTDSLQSPAE